MSILDNMSKSKDIQETSMVCFSGRRETTNKWV